VPLEKIHFHEVGAADSMADIVGACLGRATLGIDASPWTSSARPRHGALRHGVYPSPAPATLKLLQGMPVVEVDEPFETVTPTGAALLVAWRTHERIPSGFRRSLGVLLRHRKLSGRRTSCARRSTRRRRRGRRHVPRAGV